MAPRQRKGQDLETVCHRFTEEDLSDLKPKKLFANKWIIIKKLEKRGAAHCYQVCDKPCKIFGVLYLEIGDDNVTSISSQVEFSIQQYSLGYSHHFTSLLDCSIINNHVFWMVIRIRAGPTLRQLLDCCPNRVVSSITASFMAVDILSCIELLNSSGHVLRNFDAKQWKLDVKTRQFYLADTTDVGVSSDKRHRSIDEIHLLSSSQLNLSWSSQDVLYAPCSFIVHGAHMHRMNELDELEMLIYVLFDWTSGHLPWSTSKDQQKTLEMKREFLETLPNVREHFANPVDSWFNIALHNLADHLKTAKVAQQRLEKQAVRGGAWCPKGPRAGALLSIINYRRIIDDFYKIVCSGRPEWMVHWRDVKMDFDRESELTPSQREFLRKYEERQQCAQLADDWKRLEAVREHYELREEDHLFEAEKNRLCLERYLKKDGPMTADERREMEEQLEVFRDKLRLIRELKQAKRYRMTKRVKEIKEELEDEEYAVALRPSTSSSSSKPSSSSAPSTSRLVSGRDPSSASESTSSTSSASVAPPPAAMSARAARAARLALRRQMAEEGAGAVEKPKEEEAEPKKEVKEEEPDDGYEPTPPPPQKKQKTLEKNKKAMMMEEGGEIEPKQEIKLEEPDDYEA